MDEFQSWWCGLPLDVRVGIVLNVKARIADLIDETEDSPGRREMQDALYRLAIHLQRMVLMRRDEKSET